MQRALLLVRTPGGSKIGCMASDRSEPRPSENEPAAPTPAESKPLSIDRLRSAMASLLGTPAKRSGGDAPEASDPLPPADDPADDVVTLRGIVEATLFVGNERDEPIDAATIAATMADADEADVHEAVESLNAAYSRDGSPVSIERSAGGYRLRIDPSLERLADRLGRRVRAAKLSAAAQETLSVIAYRQPIAADQIDDLREKPSTAAINQLIRHQLVRRELAEGDDTPNLVTTDRFLRLVGVGSLKQLPRVAELDD